MNLKLGTVKALSSVVNRFYDLFIGGKHRPTFFNISNTFPELLILDSNFETIKFELKSLLKQNCSIPRYHDIDSYQKVISSTQNPDKNWRTFMINLMGDFNEDALKTIPNTCKFIAEIPNLFQAFFSILDPKKSIPKHKGIYKGYIRYHLGLKVPKENTPKICVNNHFYTWKERESILFDDSWYHEVFNNCNKERIVLIVDVLRPMPKIPHKLNHFITKHLIKKQYGKYIFNNIKSLKSN